MMDVRKVPRIEDTPLAGVRIIYPKIFPDERGYFCEAYNNVEWLRELDFAIEFHQDNLSYSKANVIRGLHAQPDMGKLVTCIQGKIYDVAVDARPESDNFGKYVGVVLSNEEVKSLWIPPGFLHGFAVMSKDGAHVGYKCSTVYNGSTEYGINPLDKEIGVDWPISVDEAVLSHKDKNAPLLSSLKFTKL